MPTLTEAIATVSAALKAVAPVNPMTGEVLPFGGQGEDPMVLPEEPAPFVFTVFDAAPVGTIENGGGRGANRQRQDLAVDVLVFVPNGWGLDVGTAYADAFAAALYSFKRDGVTCDRVTVHPGGPGSQIAISGITDNEAKRYFWCGCEAEFHFDTIG